MSVLKIWSQGSSSSSAKTRKLEGLQSKVFRAAREKELALAMSLLLILTWFYWMNQQVDLTAQPHSESARCLKKKPKVVWLLSPQSISHQEKYSNCSIESLFYRMDFRFIRGLLMNFQIISKTLIASLEDSRILQISSSRLLRLQSCATLIWVSNPYLNTTMIMWLLRFWKS